MDSQPDHSRLSPGGGCRPGIPSRASRPSGRPLPRATAAVPDPIHGPVPSDPDVQPRPSGDRPPSAPTVLRNGLLLVSLDCEPFADW
jgi:hypothetical protein